MTEPVSVLHLTAHLGGGVGKALSGLILNTPAQGGIRHAIACLERPEKTQFIDPLIDGGCPVALAPDPKTLARMIEEADVVQLEWWGHPAPMAALCAGPMPAMRLLLWCHVSGIHTPVIPQGLIRSAHRCLFTSPCTYEAPEVVGLSPDQKSRLGVVHSAGGFEGLQPPARQIDDTLAAGYLGSLNFAKLHPDYVEFLTSVRGADFRVRVIGDETNRDILERQCRDAGRPGMLEFRGYRTDIAAELAAINVFPYLLNPLHYGTSENALLEAMAMEVVPIVLDNPAERCLVTEGETGLFVRNPGEFGEAVDWLARHPQERLRLGRQASISVRDRFSVHRAVTAFERLYREVRAEEKRDVDFNAFIGHRPSEWFLATQRLPEIFAPDGTVSLGMLSAMILPGLLERTKGTVFHYAAYFPEDLLLKQWADRLGNVNSDSDR